MTDEVGTQEVTLSVSALVESMAQAQVAFLATLKGWATGAASLEDVVRAHLTARNSQVNVMAGVVVSDGMEG